MYLQLQFMSNLLFILGLKYSGTCKQNSGTAYKNSKAVQVENYKFTRLFNDKISRTRQGFEGNFSRPPQGLREPREIKMADRGLRLCRFWRFRLRILTTAPVTILQASFYSLVIRNSGIQYKYCKRRISI